jgi:hypothetical protein
LAAVEAGLNAVAGDAASILERLMVEIRVVPDATGSTPGRFQSGSAR